MNWDYIAGFFDGEGSISYCEPCDEKRQSASIHISIGQLARNGEVLDEIQHFLIKEGVQNPRVWKNTCRGFYPNGTRAIADMKYVLISNKRGAEVFLRYIRSLVVVKKQKVESTLKFLEGWPSLYHTRAFTEDEVAYIEKSYANDIPYFTMRATLGCCENKIYEFLKSRNLIRAENHGQFQFRKKGPPAPPAN